MIGTVEREIWRTVAADVDGVPQPAEIGKRTERASCRFAYRAEAEQWVIAMSSEGYGNPVIASAACSYYGPTDAPGNCWSATVEKVA